MGKDPHGRCFFFLGGKLLRDIKTRERHNGAELPKTLRHAPKELAQKGLRAAKEKGKEQLQQAAQNGSGRCRAGIPGRNCRRSAAGQGRRMGRHRYCGRQGYASPDTCPRECGQTSEPTGEASGGMHLAVRTPRRRALSRKKAHASSTHSRARHMSSRRAGPL